MTERVEAIRRQYDAHFVNGAHEDCGWRFGCATVRDLLTALAQVERQSLCHHCGTHNARLHCQHCGRHLAFPNRPSYDDQALALAQAEREREASIAEVNRLGEDLVVLRAEVERLNQALADLANESVSTDHVEALEADLARTRAALEKCERALRTLDREPDWLTLADEARAALEGRG